MAAALGLDLRVGLFPSGSPVCDAAHLALIERLRQRVSRALRWRAEVPVPLPGDLRSPDVVIDGPAVDEMIEAETRLDDLRALERRIRVKQRDLQIRRVVLLVTDTRHNRKTARPGRPLALPGRARGPAALAGGPRRRADACEPARRTARKAANLAASHGLRHGSRILDTPSDAPISSAASEARRAAERSVPSEERAGR